MPTSERKHGQRINGNGGSLDTGTGGRTDSSSASSANGDAWGSLATGSGATRRTGNATGNGSAGATHDSEPGGSERGHSGVGRGIGGSDSGDGARNGKRSAQRNTGNTGSADTGTGGSGRDNTGSEHADADEIPLGAPDIRIEFEPPKRVDIGDLGREKKRTSQKFDSEILRLGIETLYALPTFAFPNLPAETTQHWPLSDAEATELSARVQALLDTMPSKRKSRLMKLFEMYGPWILLAFSGYLITAPRVSLTRRLLAQHRAQHGDISPNVNASANGNGTRPADAGTQTGNTTGGNHASSAHGAFGNWRTGRTPLDADPQDY